MSEYIKMEAALEICETEYRDRLRMFDYCGDTVAWNIGSEIKALPAADVAPVVHGRWIEHEETPEDAYRHHKCSECNVNAPFDYNMREDWDEGMDGEWYSLGLVDDGINEHLTDYCPNCGARMDGDSDAKAD